MKATIEFDAALYRRLKIEAAKRGRTVRDLVAEGVRRVLESGESMPDDSAKDSLHAWRPAWLGTLGQYGNDVSDHTMSAVRQSIDRHRGQPPRS